MQLDHHLRGSWFPSKTSSLHSHYLSLKTTYVWKKTTMQATLRWWSRLNMIATCCPVVSSTTTVPHRSLGTAWLPAHVPMSFQRSQSCSSPFRVLCACRLIRSSTWWARNLTPYLGMKICRSRGATKKSCRSLKRIVRLKALGWVCFVAVAAADLALKQ